MMVDEYVIRNGTGTQMDRREFLDWVHERYENISVEKNNINPSDLTYNLYNYSQKGFPGPNLCLWWEAETRRFRLVGSMYRPNGPVIQNRGRKNECVVGEWTDGEFAFIR